jgi:hypothetical protein
MANNPTSPDSSKKSRQGPDDNGRDQPSPKDDPWLDNDAGGAASSGLESTSDEEHEEILRRLRNQQEVVGRPPPRDEEDEAPPRRKEKGNPGDDADRLLAENQELRSIIAELKQCLDDSAAQGKGNQSFEDREREYETLLEEKSEMIRELHVRVQELEKQGGGGGGGGRAAETPEQEELLALSDELERERCQLEQERRQLEGDRRQLREDEESMMRQMREMELQMAKERAELARQRNELQRLHSEIRHELEAAQRDAAVRERLQMLQRKHPQEPAAEGEDAPKKKPAKPKKESGFFGKLFGGNK